ncbi:flagellar hook-basal body complex protein FliE [bacterium]|nr:flagellar hook-basal body complex protein FliE [bacterium]
MRVLFDTPEFDFSSRFETAKGNPKEQWEKFGEHLRTAIDEVDDLEKNSFKLTQDAVLGRVENLHDVMIAAEKARVAMNLTLEVRSKVIEAYKEIMRMQF